MAAFLEGIDHLLKLRAPPLLEGNGKGTGLHLLFPAHPPTIPGGFGLPVDFWSWGLRDVSGSERHFPSFSTLPVEGMGKQEESNEMSGCSQGRDTDWSRARMPVFREAEGLHPGNSWKASLELLLTGDRDGNRAVGVNWGEALGEGQFRGPKVELSLASIAKGRPEPLRLSKAGVWVGLWETLGVG